MQSVPHRGYGSSAIVRKRFHSLNFGRLQIVAIASNFHDSAEAVHV